MLISLSEIAKIYSGNTLFEGVSFNMVKGDKLGFVGINGAGKTTLFKILMGEVTPDFGEVFKGKDTQIAYMEQHALNNSEKSVYEEVLEVFSETIAIENELKEVRLAIENKAGDLNSLVLKQHLLNEEYTEKKGFTYKGIVRSTLLGLSFSDEEQAMPVNTLSGGQKTRVVLAKILLSGANLLLLDEPTNHLDIKSTVWLEEFLKSYDGGTIIISHDRYFLDRVTNKTLELENGECRLYPANYTKYISLKEEYNLTRERVYENTTKEIARLEGIIKQQRQWNREKNIVTAESKQKIVDKLTKTLDKVKEVDNDLEFDFSPKISGGNEVLKVQNVAKTFGEKELFKNVNMFLEKGDKAFILGPNGCGKTTLINIIMGEIEGDCGEVILGANVTTAYYDQLGKSVLNDKIVLDEVWDEYPKMTQTEIRCALAAFLFKGEDVFKETKLLSGGERARISVLKIMLKNANLLILDEPTNHLDIASRESLEKALQRYNGTILCISHDRYFINKLATKIYLLNENGTKEFVGDYDNFVSFSEETKEKTEKKESANSLDYKARKELLSNIRKTKTQIERLEAEIAKTEEKIAENAKLLCSESVSSDYQKMMDIAKESESLEEELLVLMEEWENTHQKLVEMEGE